MLNLRAVLTHVIGTAVDADRQERKRAERIRDTERLLTEIREEAEARRVRERRDSSAREISDACRRQGWWWPGDSNPRSDP